jgi:hypothetical protein
MMALYIFLFVAAVYGVTAYEVLSTMTKYPQPRAQWPEKGDTPDEKNSANRRPTVRHADAGSGRRMHDHNEQIPDVLAVGKSPLDREHKPGVPVKRAKYRRVFRRASKGQWC